MKQRKFLFSINFLGTDENIVVPTINGTFGVVNKLCHDLAHQYQLRLKPDMASSCALSGYKNQIITSSQRTSMANYNWQHVDQVLELGIGVSCCPKPKEETLSAVWNRIRPAIVGLL